MLNTNSSRRFVIPFLNFNIKKVYKVLTASLCTIENLELIEDGMFMENNMIEFMQCYIPLFMDGFEEYGSNSDLILEKSKKLKSMSKIFSAK